MTYYYKLSPTSKKNISMIDNINYHHIQKINTHNLLSLSNDMKSMSAKHMNINNISSTSITKIKNIFKEFDRDHNCKNISSIFRNSIDNASNIYRSYTLKVNDCVIYIYFMVMIDNYINIIMSILHALNTFCHMFHYNYCGLK